MREELDSIIADLRQPRTLSQFMGAHDMALALMEERNAIADRLAALAPSTVADEGSLTYAEQRKVVEHMTTELGAAIGILQSVQQRAEAIDCQPLPATSAPGVSDAMAPIRAWWAFVQAGSELDGYPIPDDDVILYFSGNGASTRVTAGQLRAALETAQPQPGRVEGMGAACHLGECDAPVESPCPKCGADNG